MEDGIERNQISDFFLKELIRREEENNKCIKKQKKEISNNKDDKTKLKSSNINSLVN